MKACGVHISGVVQGVGFRPYVWSLAARFGIRGWVRNNSSGVDLVAEGSGPAVDDFLSELRGPGPPLARVDTLDMEPIDPAGYDGFEILESEELEGAYVPVSPDVAVCGDCLEEMADPSDRRYRYPFINCTNCGPRFTIVDDVPYDRPRTTMADFPMCPECEAEYRDPSNRRFHAQPVACPACGPEVWLEVYGVPTAAGEDALRAAKKILREGGILAAKGLGGFHLACDATNAAAVRRLRDRKRREGKPFAVMAVDREAVRLHARLTAGARRLLQSAARPIVLLPRIASSKIAYEVAPGRTNLGFMLPYTPLHHLLLESAPGFPDVLVMTSGNTSDEPIAYENADARERLAPVADAFLMHGRRIQIRCDDSVAAEVNGEAYFFRRSRGYAPLSIPLPAPSIPLLAVGAELKNTFCLARDHRAFPGHHIGDLEYAEAYNSFVCGLEHFERLFRFRPELLAHDLHPDYQSTRYALERSRVEGIPAVAVQHHHAHVAACMADNGLGPDERVIGVVFDGTGYGTDGAIWGGEILVAGYSGFERALHVTYCPLPGGDAAVRRPFRTALAWLRQAGVQWTEDLSAVRAAPLRERDVLTRQLEAGINAPPTSSMGRLFDAVASLVGVCHRINHEAQAACELEALVDPAEKTAYRFRFEAGEIDAAPVIRSIVADTLSGVAAPLVAARFHNGVAAMVAHACRQLRETTGLATVALSGGVWQNVTLLEKTKVLLDCAGFLVLVHRQVPANDGGLALGQVMVAAATRGRKVSAVRTQAENLIPQGAG